MPIQVGLDTARTRSTLTVGGKSFSYYSIQKAEQNGFGNFSKLPAALRVVLENLLTKLKMNKVNYINEEHKFYC